MIIICILIYWFYGNFSKLFLIASKYYLIDVRHPNEYVYLDPYKD
jgi:hypothetical protein